MSTLGGPAVSLFIENGPTQFRGKERSTARSLTDFQVTRRDVLAEGKWKETETRLRYAREENLLRSRLREVPFPLSPSYVTRKKTTRKKKGARAPGGDKYTLLTPEIAGNLFMCFDSLAGITFIDIFATHLMSPNATKKKQLFTVAILLYRFPPGGGGGGLLRSIFAGYVPLASWSPYPIIVYFVANCRPHLSHFWANMSFSRSQLSHFIFMYVPYIE